MEDLARILNSMVSFVIKWKESSDSDVITRSTALRAKLFQRIGCAFPANILSEDVMDSHIDGASSSATRLEIKDYFPHCLNQHNELEITTDNFIDYISTWLLDFGNQNKDRIDYINYENKGNNLPDIESTIWENA